MKRLATGPRTRFILGRQRGSLRSRRPWFDKDRAEIVACWSNGEAVFSGFCEKWLLGTEMDKMVPTGGPRMHLHKAPKLSSQWGSPHRWLQGILASSRVKLGSNMKAFKLAMPNKFFAERGLLTLSDYGS